MPAGQIVAEGLILPDDSTSKMSKSIIREHKAFARPGLVADAVHLISEQVEHNGT